MPDTYAAVCLNLESGAATEYTNYQFNSFANFNGETYAATSAGLYKLGGNTDAGSAIAASFKTGLTDFGSSHKKQIIRGWVNLRNDGSMLLKASNGEQLEASYRITTTSTRIHPDRFKLGRGLKNVYWQFEMENVSGADFEIDRLEVIPLMLQRKVY